MASAQRWIPLESNPKYVHDLGMDSTWNFVDVYGLDDELLAMVPQPVAAVVLLFPSRKDANEEPLGEVRKESPGDVYFLKQTIGNACGTVAIVHALANNPKIPFDESLHFKAFLNATKAMTPEERAKHLEDDSKMGAAHEGCAQEGDTQAPSQNEKVDSHFVALVNVGDTLFELDGTKEGPIAHGTTSADEFLKAAAGVVKKFMARDPDNVNFNVMALVQGGDN